MDRKSACATLLVVTLLILPLVFHTPNVKSHLETNRSITIKNQRLFSLYFGGGGYDYGNDIIIDSSDNIIVVGSTSSTDFPTLNASDATFNGDADGFIVKFSSTGIVRWSTFLGGTQTDQIYGVAVDSQDNIIVTGITTSNNFPTLNPYKNNTSSYNGEEDCFIAKFSSFGTLTWSTYYGGSNDDYGADVAIDSFDNIVVTGYTNSSGFPTLNASDPTFNGDGDFFLAKFSSTGMLEWSTFLGGNSSETDYYIGRGQTPCVAVDSQDKILVTGNTLSMDFPTLNAFNNTSSGFDGFISKFSENGELEWSTFLGGCSSDIAVDSQDFILVTGFTYFRNFPTLNAYDNKFNGILFDGIIMKFTSYGKLEWSTFLGGTSDDFGMNVAVDSQDNVLITGSTESPDFPVSNAFDSSYNQGEDGFILKLTQFGEYKWSSFFGGASGRSSKIVVDSQDYFIVLGTRYTGYTEQIVEETESMVIISVSYVDIECFLYHMLDPLIDTDSDQLPDYWEYEMDFDPNNPLDAEQDFDNDGLTNLQEFIHGLDPTDSDFDNDGALDGEEFGQPLLDPKNSFFNPTSRMVILFFIIVLPGIGFIFLSFRWRQQKLKRK